MPDLHTHELLRVLSDKLASGDDTPPPKPSTVIALHSHPYTNYVYGQGTGDSVLLTKLCMGQWVQKQVNMTSA